jgi:hypothetical protein
LSSSPPPNPHPSARSRPSQPLPEAYP